MNKLQNRQISAHIVACIEKNNPEVITLLRIARARAQEKGCSWCALFITTSQSGSDEQSVADWISAIAKQAEKMGAGSSVYCNASTIEQGLAQALDDEHKRIDLLVIGDDDARKSGVKASFSLNTLIQQARKRNIPVEVVSLASQQYTQSFKERYQFANPQHILYAFIAVGCASLCAWILDYLLSPTLFRINNQNVSLLFMIACAFCASRYGLLSSLVASIVSFFILNYFFTVPYYALKFDNITDTINLLLFLSAAFLISLFTSQTQGYAQKAAKREVNTQALFTLYRVASNATSRKQALEELQVNLTRMLAMDVAFFLPPAINPDAIELAYPLQFSLNQQETEALNFCWKNMEVTGLASSRYADMHWRFEPMIAQGGEVGVFGVRPQKQNQLDTWFCGLLTAIADQTASVLEHMELESSMEATRIREEREKLRSMLLSSVSHDLRTPLASMIGALSIYRSQGKKLSPEKREILIETALEESERLDSFITNILNMTHLESGKIQFKKEWHDFHTLTKRVLKRMENRLRQHNVKVHNAETKVEVMLDVIMTEQVLQNVLDNATKYTKPGTSIDIVFTANPDGTFSCSIRDHGNGLPPEKLNKIFDKYARLHKRDMQVAGTGLGLAICKTVMESQDGAIIAENHPEGGAQFILHFDKWRPHDVTTHVA